MKDSKNSDEEKKQELEVKALQEKLFQVTSELEAKKQATADQELTVRVIQDRLVYTSNEAEKFKRLAQKRFQELSSFCSTFLRESAVEFEMGNDFEKSLDALKGINYESATFQI